MHIEYQIPSNNKPPCIRAALWQAGRGYALARLSDAGVEHIRWLSRPEDGQGSLPLLPSTEAAALLDALMQGKVPLLAFGTDFQLAVWQAVANIDYGATRSYTQIAQAIGSKGVRAVGTAVGANPLYWCIPCHRVVGSKGALGGYRWGLEHKQALLASEQQPRQQAQPWLRAIS